MKLLRKLLFPFSFLYWMVTNIRNFCFDTGILKSYQFDIPIIAVGNLSVGGTGKSPQIEYLIRLLSSNYKIATLSRGYKRKSGGFVLANENVTAEILGDEPFQFYKKFPNIQVAVAANRKNGIEQLLHSEKKTEVILLDDAYQHRKVKAGFYILLTTYNDLYVDDYLLPVGNLRESATGAKRADILIVTKCPEKLSVLAQETIKKRIGLNIPVFFSYIAYDEKIYSETDSKLVSELANEAQLLIAGIAKPKPFFDFLENGKTEKLVFSDHHHFTASEIVTIKNKSKNKISITTEKDFVRLKNKNIDSLFYLPIKSNFLSESALFDTSIINFVESQINKKSVY